MKIEHQETFDSDDQTKLNRKHSLFKKNHFILNVYLLSLLNYWGTSFSKANIKNRFFQTFKTNGTYLSKSKEHWNWIDKKNLIEKNGWLNNYRLKIERKLHHFEITPGPGCTSWYEFKIAFTCYTNHKTNIPTDGVKVFGRICHLIWRRKKYIIMNMQMRWCDLSFLTQKLVFLKLEALSGTLSFRG